MIHRYSDLREICHVSRADIFLFHDISTCVFLPSSRGDGRKKWQKRGRQEQDVFFRSVLKRIAVITQPIDVLITFIRWKKQVILYSFHVKLITNNVYEPRGFSRTEISERKVGQVCFNKPLLEYGVSKSSCNQRVRALIRKSIRFSRSFAINQSAICTFVA